MQEICVPSIQIGNLNLKTNPVPTSIIHAGKRSDISSKYCNKLSVYFSFIIELCKFSISLTTPWRYLEKKKIVSNKFF